MSPITSLIEAVRSLAASGDARQAVALAQRMAAERRLEPDIQNEIGAVLFQLGAFDASATCFRDAIKLAPDRSDYLTNLGIALVAARRLTEAEAMLREAVRLDPQAAMPRLQLGDLLVQRRRVDEAEAVFRQLIAAHPGFVPAHQKLGNLLLQQRRMPEIIALAEQLVLAAPHDPDAHEQLSVAYELVGRLEDALTATNKALALRPPQSLTMSVAAHASLVAATGRIAEREAVKSNIVRLSAEPLDDPGGPAADITALRRLAFLAPYYGVADPLRLRVMGFLGDQIQARYPAAPPAPRQATSRLRVGYLSHNFGDHPLGHLLAPFFEAHHGGAMDLILYSLNRRDSDRSGYPERLRRAAGQNHDLSGLDDDAAAAAIRASQPDILFDLDGYLGGGRPEILARRPAPVQIHWLQHLAGMPAPFIDYTIVDKVLTPDDEVSALNGPLIRLPHAFQCGDQVPLPERLETRAAFGLPADAFVFCGFNSWLKIDGETLACWADILAATPNSVLWLMAGANDAAVARFVEEAGRFGIAANRMVFASRVANKAEHLGRHRLADLFLDTLGFSAATTAVDALWAGLPVVTRHAPTAHGRLSESQLRAAGCPELVAEDPRAYVDLATALAHDRPRLEGLKLKLETQGRRSALFDSKGLAAQFAGLCEFVAARRRDGAPAISFDVTPDGACSLWRPAGQPVSVSPPGK
jgi:predicted O-linked N-acetylglucosamine transferase (SPINDLY family)